MMTFMCLAYHRITYEPNVPFAVTTERLRRDMLILKTHGFQGVSMTDALKDNDHKIALTFDDGTWDFVTCAMPILDEFYFRATIFVVPGLLGQLGTWPEAAGEPLMPSSALIELSRVGIEIGSHSMTHKALLAQRNPEFEIASCVVPGFGFVHGFSYPFGQYNDKVERMVANVFDYAVTCDPRLCDGTMDRYHLGRFVMDMNHEPDLSLLS